MTAYLLHRTPDGNMHLFADGALTTIDDVLDGTCLKVEVQNVSNFVWIVAGTSAFRCLFAKALANNSVIDFDDLAENVSGLVEVVQGQLHQLDLPPRYFEFQLCFAGWSKAEQRVKAFTYENSPLCDGPKLQLEPAETYMSPGPRPLPSGAMNFDWPSPDLAGEALRSWAIAAMEAMRKVWAGVYRNTSDQHSVIGGHVQHVAIGPDRITSEVVHVWRDVLGQPIDGGVAGCSVGDLPAVTHSVRTPEGGGYAMAAAPLGFGLGHMGLTSCLGGVRRG